MHKTGSTLIAGVLFRMAARHNLRIWHRGQWAFAPANTFNEDIPRPPEDKHKYHMMMDSLNPRGYWRGPFEKAIRFYQYIISQDTSMISIFREPTQHYISWVACAQGGATSDNAGNPLPVARCLTSARCPSPGTSTTM